MVSVLSLPITGLVRGSRRGGWADRWAGRTPRPGQGTDYSKSVMVRLIISICFSSSWLGKARQDRAGQAGPGSAAGEAEPRAGVREAGRGPCRSRAESKRRRRFVPRLDPGGQPEAYHGGVGRGMVPGCQAASLQLQVIEVWTWFLSSMTCPRGWVMDEGDCGHRVSDVASCELLQAGEMDVVGSEHLHRRQGFEHGGGEPERE
ncbi:hypothetical protein F5X68DRAFT_79400 [Plectosphaerella plurivora]|uniref:Uncharacterized protein n=1 Tax=Plectosphaerella plurivora TaxID=936078 RepID=A0A9P8VDF0_9PEZI|nr:hypothetical protein F5X68DRAFT_79400 [Plectosphaerella plurivora]